MSGQLFGPIPDIRYTEFDIQSDTGILKRRIPSQPLEMKNTSSSNITLKENADKPFFHENMGHEGT